MTKLTEGRTPGAANDPTVMLGMNSHELDELFRSSPAGQVPDGRGRGTVLFAPGTFVARLIARILYVVAWRGKVVDRSGGSLLNIITPFGINAIKAKVYKEKSWFDGQECIVLDYSKTSFSARWIRDEIREVAPGVFLGLVFWSKSRILKFALVFPSP